MGADPNITEVRGMLARPDVELECYDSLLEHLMQRSSDWDWIVWGGIPQAAAACLGRHGRPVWLPDIPCFLLELPSSWEEFKSTRSRNIKESLRKCNNSLKRAGLHAAFKVADRGPELERVLDELVRLHGMRAARTDTIRHANVFAKENAIRFLSEVCARYETSGGVRVFSLEVEGRTCAARLAFSVGDSLYLSYSGYDPQFGQYSVMTNLVAGAIRYAIDEGFRSVNLSTGSDVSKTRWSPRRVESKVAMMPSRAGRASFAMRLYNELRRPFAPAVRASAFPSMIRRSAAERTESPPSRAA
jgi:CelD/BcsL family acetyltransferase involved in cellulose biosynthesis